MEWGGWCGHGGPAVGHHCPLTVCQKEEHLLLDLSWQQVTETAESKMMDKGGPLYTGFFLASMTQTLLLTGLEEASCYANKCLWKGPFARQLHVAPRIWGPQSYNHKELNSANSCISLEDPKPQRRLWPQQTPWLQPGRLSCRTQLRTQLSWDRLITHKNCQTINCYCFGSLNLW